MYLWYLIQVAPSCVLAEWLEEDPIALSKRSNTMMMKKGSDFSPSSSRCLFLPFCLAKASTRLSSVSNQAERYATAWSGESSVDPSSAPSDSVSSALHPSSYASRDRYFANDFAHIAEALTIFASYSSRKYFVLKLEYAAAVSSRSVPLKSLVNVFLKPLNTHSHTYGREVRPSGK